MEKSTHREAAAARSASANDADQFLEHYRRTYRDAPYYSPGRSWPDYAPAYRYGRERCAHRCGRRFEEEERMLEDGWEQARGNSRLTWTEARQAVRTAWRDTDRG